MNGAISLNYQEKELALKDSFAFWQNFEDEERVLFYHPFKQQLIMGARRLKTFGTGESYRGYPYVFSTRTFFPSLKDPKWSGLGNETIAFQYYLVEEKAGQKLYYANETADISAIPPKEFAPHRHDYEVLADDYQEWQELFQCAKQKVLAGKVQKVVISREIKIQCKTMVFVESVLKNLLEKNPHSFIFAYYKEGKTFLGATPEILARKEKGQIMSYALAGTRARTADEGDEQGKTALLNDPKNRHEHQIVLDYIAKVMNTYSDEVMIGETTTLQLRNLYHLKTPLAAKAKENSSLTDWVARLHPTPALGGYPVAEALAIIARWEKHERGLYAAPLGIMNEEGDGIFVAGIRSALIEGKTVYAYTGCGIVASSECAEEYAETAHKAQTILESL
ncbi:isochorismate synthase [Desulfitobacterium hafniense]|uniref:isochorismate synthase n=1 Tax=Desulfitobacterium hafniense TaxID=49338 RepID=UPI000367F3C7|nr:isochorismate synthase [Desulfitobacterium hafniense]